MPTKFSRMIKRAALDENPDLLDETRAEIQAHLSIVTSPDDNEEVHAHEVEVWEEEQDNGDVLVRGTIDRDPVAMYLEDDFDPEEEARANPLSVPSHFGEPTTFGEPLPAEYRVNNDSHGREPGDPVYGEEEEPEFDPEQGMLDLMAEYRVNNDEDGEVQP